MKGFQRFFLVFISFNFILSDKQVQQQIFCSHKRIEAQLNFIKHKIGILLLNITKQVYTHKKVTR